MAKRKSGTKELEYELQTADIPHYVDFGDDVEYPFDIVVSPGYDWRRLSYYHYTISGIFYRGGEVFHAVRVRVKLTNKETPNDNL